MYTVYRSYPTYTLHTKLRGHVHCTVITYCPYPPPPHELRGHIHCTVITYYPYPPHTQSSVNAVSTRLLEKTQELNTVQMENDRLESMLSVMEGKIKAVEGTSRAKVSSLEAEVEQLQDSIRQYESLMVEYKGQLDSGRLEVEGSSRELKHKDEEVERAKHAGALELEKVRECDVSWGSTCTFYMYL